jgi:hypothetical protein
LSHFDEEPLEYQQYLNVELIISCLTTCRYAIQIFLLQMLKALWLEVLTTKWEESLPSLPGKLLATLNFFILIFLEGRTKDLFLLLEQKSGSWDDTNTVLNLQVTVLFVFLCAFLNGDR